MLTLSPLLNHLTRPAALGPAFGLLAASACSFQAGALSPDCAPSDGASQPSGPTILRPIVNQNLAPARAFLLWQDGPIPAGRSVSGYELCSTTGPAADIDEVSECPNAFATQMSFAALGPLATSATYNVKARTRFDDMSVSADSELRSFTTDASVVGWWFMDGTPSDASGRNHDGVLQGGAVYAGGFIGQALSLDGNNDSLTITSSNDHNFGTGDFTLSAWIRPARNGVAEAIITKRSTSNGYELFRTSGGRLAFFGSGCGIAVTGGSLPMNAWHRISAVRSAGTVFLYVNDALSGSAACADNFANSADLTFGCSGPDLGCAEAFQGLIDDVSVRNAASSADDVLNGSCADLAAGGVAPLPAACQ